MKNKNLKQILNLGVLGLTAIFSLNLAVFAGIDQDDRIEENRDEEINLDVDLAAEDNNGEEINLGDLAAEENNGEETDLLLEGEKLDYIKEFERMRKEAEAANDIKRKNFYQEKMKMDERGNYKRNILQKDNMLGKGGYVIINETTFPDYNFRKYVIEKLNEVRLENLIEKARDKAEKIGEDAKAAEEKVKEMYGKCDSGTFAKRIEDGSKVRLSEMEEIKMIDVSYKGIEDLKGIEYFRNLEVLYCSNNKLTELNVENNVNLVVLYCYNNNLTELNVANKVNLVDLDCSNNNLRELNVANKVNLVDLDCSNNNLENLVVANNVNLQILNCENNNLRELNVANNGNLEVLECSNNNLTELDVSGLGQLWKIYARNNENLREIIARNCPRLNNKYIYHDEGCNVIRD